MGCSGIKSNQKGFTLPLILRTVPLLVTHTHTPLLTHNILNSQTQNTEKAPSATPAAFTVPLFIVKKGRRETKKPKKTRSEFISTRGSVPSVYSLHTRQKGTFTFWRHPPSQSWQITKKEGGSDWRLEPLISLEKECARLGGPEWPFADKTAAERDRHGGQMRY